jgi:hypothetical protein
VALVGPVGSWFQIIGKVTTLLWRWLVLLVPVPDGREGSYLAVALVGPVGSWFQMVGKVPSYLAGTLAGPVSSCSRWQGRFLPFCDFG